MGRIFPFYRGLYEDKVANIWCSLSPVLKLKAHFSIPTILRLWYFPIDQSICQHSGGC